MQFFFEMGFILKVKGNSLERGRRQWASILLIKDYDGKVVMGRNPHELCVQERGSKHPGIYP
jgi:hypothetical protein